MTKNQFDSITSLIICVLFFTMAAVTILASENKDSWLSVILAVCGLISFLHARYCRDKQKYDEQGFPK